MPRLSHQRTASDPTTLTAALFEAYPEPALVLDDARRVLFANAAAAALMVRDDVVGHPLGEVLPDGLATEVRRLCVRARRTRRAERHGCTCGAHTWQLTAVPLDGGTGVTLCDATAQREAAELLRVERDHGAALLDSMSVGLLVTDLEGTVRQANRRFLEIAGLTEELVVGARIPHGWWTEQQDAAMGMFWSDALRGRPGQLECTLRARSGREFPVRVGARALRDPRGTLTGVVVTVADVTDEHVARQRLRLSEAEFRVLAEQTTDLICRHDRNGRMRYVSPAARLVLGRSPFAARGLHLEHFLVAGDRAELTRALTAVLEDGVDRTVVVRGQRPHGVSWLETTIRRIGTAATGDQLISTTRDVTDRHLAQLENASVARVSDALAAGADVTDAGGLLCEDLGTLLGAVRVGLWRLRDGTAEVAASWDPAPGAERRSIIPVPSEADPVAAVIRYGRGPAVGVPVQVNGRLWGVLVAGLPTHVTLADEAEGRLARFATLAATTVERAEASAALMARAQCDPLTQLANRAVFDERLAQAAARGERLALCIADLDNFKNVNDTYGHDRGDEVLRRVANLLSQSARRGDLVARLGGEEFGWVMPRTSLRAAVLAAERAREAVAAAAMPPTDGVTVSVGISVSGNGWDPADVFRRADRALYMAKANGRNRVVGLPERAA